MGQVVKRSPGRPRKTSLDLVEVRFSMSFPNVREEDLRRAAQREGLPISSYLRRVVLLHLDKKRAV